MEAGLCFEGNLGYLSCCLLRNIFFPLQFLINIDDDQGPSIESARPAYGSNAQRLMKYSTSGMRKFIHLNVIFELIRKG